MNKKEVFNPNWPFLTKAKYTYNLAVKKGNLLVLSGMGSVDPETGKTLWPGDIVAQTRQTYENIKAVLEAAGATLDDVIKTTEYIVPSALPNYRATVDVRREYFKNDPPAATGVVVSSLVRHDLLIEIDVIAVI